ncbi:MAG: Lrp/AsnC family transcriptional regulator [Candidatus Helarchaeota archaeon]
MENLDDVNQKIIHYLKRDGRASFADIANRLKISESTVRKRVNKLINNNLISHFTVVLNKPKHDRKVLAFLTISPLIQSNIKDIADQILKFADVTEGYYMSGKCGLLIKIEVDNLDRIDETIDVIRGIPGVKEIESCIVLRSLKDEIS